MNETYQDAKLLAIGILNYINAFDEQGGDKQAMLKCLYEASLRCDKLKFKIETMKNKLKDEREEQ
jgi:hypothetical protein